MSVSLGSGTPQGAGGWEQGAAGTLLRWQPVGQRPHGSYIMGRRPPQEHGRSESRGKQNSKKKFKVRGPGRNSPLLANIGATPPTEATSWGDAPHRNLGRARAGNKNLKLRPLAGTLSRDKNGGTPLTEATSAPQIQIIIGGMKRTKHKGKLERETRNSKGKLGRETWDSKQKQREGETPKEKRPPSTRKSLKHLHNIFSSLLNPPAPPSPSSLTAEDFTTFYTEKIERICQTFTSPPTSSTSHSQDSTTPSLTQLSTVAAEEVLQIIRPCNPTTCPLDPIPSAMLQTISPELLPFITTVINGSLTSGHVPTVFKKTRVIPILKKPALDPSDISNYRPVSLLSFPSKIFERVVCNQLSDYLLQNNLHDPNQSDFKAAHSTETALLVVTENLHAASQTVIGPHPPRPVCSI
ncbi:hypothetical protein QTP86_031272 [Hemibagrus guttatus]|nr:hypothetical protein QTP86_031272 [Hemibagrus guttatus]